jgi:hypothetical protein
MSTPTTKDFIMGLEDFLAQEDKVAALEALRNRTFSELYTICTRLGIDTETFEYETWELPEHTEENASIYMNFRMIQRMCESLKIIDAKIG